MKTKEELQFMSHDEFVNYSIMLQEDVKKINDNADYWYNEYHQEASCFISFINSVKSVVELIEFSRNE